MEGGFKLTVSSLTTTVTVDVKYRYCISDLEEAGMFLLGDSTRTIVNY